MTSVRRRVEQFIERDAALRRDLARGLLNQRALARYIQKKTMLPGSIDAILSAIRRYVPETETTVEITKIFRQSRLRVRDRMITVTLENGKDVLQSIAQLATKVNTSKGEVLRVIVGLESIKVVLDERNLPVLTENIWKPQLNRVTDNLSEIAIAFPSEAERTSGIVSRITAELQLNSINLVEIMSCAPELILLVKDDDATKAYSALQALLKQTQ